MITFLRYSSPPKQVLITRKTSFVSGKNRFSIIESKVAKAKLHLQIFCDNTKFLMPEISFIFIGQVQGFGYGC